MVLEVVAEVAATMSGVETLITCQNGGVFNLGHIHQHAAEGAVIVESPAHHFGQGKGVEKNYVKSYAWMYVASRGKEQRALKGLNKVTEKLDHIQIIEAESLGRSFVEKYRKDG